MPRFYPTHADMNDDMSDLFREPVLEDHQDKFIVIKTEHAIKRLSEKEKAALVKMLGKLANKNEYWVVNKDEPYAKQVRDLIKTDEAEKVR